MKRVAVIGYTSMLGGRLCELLSGRKVSVIKCGRGPESDIVIDLSSEANTFKKDLGQVEALFSCAAGFFDDSWEGCRNNGRVNTLGCYWILELAQALQCASIINAGTVSSIEGSETTSMSSYGLSKAMGENILEWGMEKIGGSFISLRFPQLYDEFGLCCRHQQWFGRIVAYAAAGKNLRMPESSGPRNFLHVSDASELLIAAWQRAAKGHLNLTHPEMLDYRQIAETAYNVFGKGGAVIEAPEKKAFRNVQFPDGEAAFVRLAYRPKVTMRTGLSMIKNLGTQNNFGPMDVT